MIFDVVLELTRNVMQTPLEVQDTRRVHGDFEDLVGMLY